MTPAWRPSRLVKAVFGAALFATLLGGAWKIAAAVGAAPSRPDITDFHAVHLVGQLIAAGHLADAYRASVMLRLELALGDRPVFMPWSYPPAYGFVAAPLHALGLVPGFLVFSLASLALYVAAMRRLGGEDCWPVLLASFVAMALNLRCGQNGLLTGGLVALAATLTLRRRSVAAGAALAALSLKPHLVLAVPLWLAWRRRWLVLAVAGAGAAALTLLSLAVFGREAFQAFLASMPDVGRMMAAGAYPLHRMTSIYAFALSLGLPSWLALLLHGAAAALVLALVGRQVLAGTDPRLELGLAIMAGLFVSPYVYDYDQTVFGVALLLLAPALLRRLGQRRYLLLLGGCGTVPSLGLLVNTVTGGAPDGAVSLMGPALLALALTIIAVVRGESIAMLRSRAESLPA